MVSMRWWFGSMLLISACANVITSNSNHLYSEGGSFSGSNDQPVQRSTTVDTYALNGNAESQEYFDTEYQEPNLYRTDSLPAIAQERQRERLAKILEQLKNDRNRGNAAFVEEEDEPAINPNEPHQRNRNAEELAELRHLGMAIREMNQQRSGKFNEGETEQPEAFAESGIGNNEKKAAAVKKGQSEFVEFVEPQQNNRLKTVEWMEKRVPNDAYGDGQGRDGRGPFKFFANSENVLFIAYLAICLAGVMAGTVGGVYYYNHIRTARTDDPFNEFTHYYPSGPSKDKLKKDNKPVAGAQGFTQTGDDTLAYKAQLHHYQQQKQKILGATGAPSGSDVMSENEEDTIDELEHNFSVYECPGLAPTGDVEIQNPNFVGDNGNGKKVDESKKDRVD